MQSAKIHPCLSVAMIARNAAEPLAETLESIRPIADEIIVVDTGSTDATQAVANRFQAKFYSQAWQDDFSAARNLAGQLCVGEWILWLDAGERLSRETALALREFIDTEARPDTAYMLVVRLPAQPGEIAGEQIGMIRLVPNDPAIKFTGRVRESLVPSLTVAKLQIEGLPYRIDRGQRELDGEMKLRRAKRNIQLAELAMREQGPTATLLNCLGESFQLLGQSERAAQFFHQAIGQSASGSSEMLAGYYGLIAAMACSDQGHSAQLNTCVAALDIFPLDAQLLCASGGYLQSLGQLDMATKAYQTAYRFGRVNPEVWHLDGIIEVAISCYAQALCLQGKLPEALATLQAEVQSYPQSLRLRRQLLGLYVQQGNRKAALAQAEMLPPETPYREALLDAIRGACLAVGKNWVPARAFLEAAYRNGSRDPICLQWYARTLLANGETAAAVPVLAEWRASEPHHPEMQQLLAAVSQAVSGNSAAAERNLRLDANGETAKSKPQTAAVTATVTAAS